MRGDQFARWKLARAVEASPEKLPKTVTPQNRNLKHRFLHKLEPLQVGESFLPFPGELLGSRAPIYFILKFLNQFTMNNLFGGIG